MALNLYLDDCSNSDLLADLLRQAGHRVVRPTDEGIGLEGEDDPVHLGFAAAHGLRGVPLAQPLALLKAPAAKTAKDGYRRRSSLLQSPRRRPPALLPHGPRSPTSLLG